MNDPIAAYLAKRAVQGPWLLSHVDLRGITQAVVIPALAESAHLFDTLGDLAENTPAARDATLVVCVVNNRALPHGREEDTADNRRTLTRLESYSKTSPLRLTWVDAASDGCALPPKEGVGLARKIGLDLALAALHAEGARGPLISLDADTRVDADYLAVIRARFAAASRPGAALVAYAHPLDGPPATREAMLAYELYLRAHELGLRRAGSPYAYPAIGSTIVCAPEAYAAVGGMRRRLAAEDFYFLQALAKTGPIARIPEVVVRPAARPSHRVPFGTGATIRQRIQPHARQQRLYAAESYRVLRRVFNAADLNFDLVAPAFVEALAVAAEHPALRMFLESQRFPDAWAEITRHAHTRAQRHSQFHGWLDAFRTMKLFHYLRDQGCSRTELYAGLPEVLRWAGVEKVPETDALRGSFEVRLALLERLRATWGEISD